MDQEGIPFRRFSGLIDEVEGDTDVSLAEELAVGGRDFGDSCVVEIDPVGPPQEGGNAFIEKVGHR